MEKKFCALILSGGTGTRFWPLSTKKKPKQYLNLIEGKSLLASTLERLTPLINPKNIFVMTTTSQESLVKNHKSDNILVEPIGKNTAPCIFYSLLCMIKDNISPDTVVAIMPSDHVILNTEVFRQDLTAIYNQVHNSNKIVTIGIKPHFPHTGFGYIETAAGFQETFMDVVSFKEKPPFETACDYLKKGNYFWNAGMFLGRIDSFLAEFAKWSPEIYQLKDLFLKDVTKAYNEVKSISIDYAIMEKSRNLLIYKAQFDWNDLGSWSALEDLSLQENTILPTKDEAFKYIDNAKGNIVYCDTSKSISLVDVQDLLIISNSLGLVVMPKNKAENMKEIVGYFNKRAPHLT